MVEEMSNAKVNDLGVGDNTKGTVTKIEDKAAFVDVGFKVDGILPISELSSLHIEKVSDVLAVGDEIELKVIKAEDDELVLSRRAVSAEKAWVELKEKFAAGEAIETEIAEVVKGGLVVDLGIRGFIPASLVERHFVEDFSEYKGKTVKVKIIELDQAENKLILSRRAVLDEEVVAKQKELINSIKPGQIMEGTVQRITNFGAFVNINGVDGLVHISQMSHERVESPSEVVQVGDKVKVKVLSVNPENERIALSIKDTLPGPWDNVANDFKAGDIIDGTVRRLVGFGAFVEIAPGIEGLVHISQIANRHIGTPSEVLKVGEVVKTKILDINLDDKRISLSIREVEEEQEKKEREQYTKYEEEPSGFSLGDMIGDQLKKYK